MIYLLQSIIHVAAGLAPAWATARDRPYQGLKISKKCKQKAESPGETPPIMHGCGVWRKLLDLDHLEHDLPVGSLGRYHITLFSAQQSFANGRLVGDAAIERIGFG